MHLGMFYWPCGHHMASWRHPDGVADSGGNIAHIVELAKLAERGLFDLFFMADSVSFWRGDLKSMTRDSFGTWIEPFTVMCSVAQHTRHIGLVCTSTTSDDQPYLLARRFASLDVTSGGRAGWNLITSANKLEAASFGLDEHLEKTERYRRAREFAHAPTWIACGTASTPSSRAGRWRASIPRAGTARYSLPSRTRPATRRRYSGLMSMPAIAASSAVRSWSYPVKYRATTARRT